MLTPTVKTCDGPIRAESRCGEWNIYAEHEVERCAREACDHHTIDRQHASVCCECGGVTCGCCSYDHTVTCTEVGCSNAACEACIHPMDPAARSWVCTECAETRAAWEEVVHA